MINGYYRSFEQIIFDIDRIYHNSCQFNGNDNEITMIALEMIIGLKEQLEQLVLNDALNIQ